MFRVRVDSFCVADYGSLVIRAGARSPRSGPRTAVHAMARSNTHQSYGSIDKPADELIGSIPSLISRQRCKRSW